MKQKLSILRSEFEAFNIKNGRYPTALEIKAPDFSFSTKTIQRTFGSLKELRTLLDLDIIDYTTGSFRSKKAAHSTKNAFKEQSELYKKLLPIFGKYYIHRESVYGDTGRQRSDFLIYHAQGNFYIDIFYASDTVSMSGCINAKLRKYDPSLIWGEIILVNTNPELDSHIPTLLANKKNPIPNNITLLTVPQLLAYCQTLAPHCII